MIPYYEYVNQEYQISTAKNFSFPAHLHSGIEIMYVTSGVVYAQYGEEEIKVNQGELVVFFPNKVHAYLSSGKDSSFNMYLYRSKMRSEIANVFTLKEPENIVLSCIPNDIKVLLEYLAQKNGDSPLVTKLYFELILAKLFPLMNLKERESNLPQDLLVSVLSYIQENFAENISLEVLSKKFGVSKYKISRLFTNTINVSLTDYVNTLRVERSKSFLKDPEISIIETAFNCGFESQQTFNRVFKRLTKMTPKEYRKK